MVFRLPTHLESYIPPPSQQAPEQRPWRGALIVRGMRLSDRSSSQTIRVTAVETDGDKTDLWPAQFLTHITHGHSILQDVQGWVKRHAPPLCTFMPDRHRDPNINAVNQTTFRTLSRILFETQTVAVAGWGTNEIPGAGIIIFPAQNSSSLLVGALFLSEPFPAFVTGTPSPTMPLSPTDTMQAGYMVHYAQPISAPYGSSSRHHQSVSPQGGGPAGHVAMPGGAGPYPTSGYPASPIDPSQQHHAHMSASASHQPDQYSYMMTRGYSSTPTSSSAENPWPAVKDEDDGTYAPFSPHHENPHYP